jgi:acyl-CoA hydrolase
MSDGAMALIERGAITNARKPVDAGMSVTGALLGSRRLAAFAHLNSSIGLRPISYTHAFAVIAALPRFTAVNSATEVDLAGQANTEIAGGRYVGAVGGAVDFARGANASMGGMPILALPSVAEVRGEKRSRIVTRLSGPATIGCADAGVIVTEHGVADLRGLSLSQRARKLIMIADPAFRESLERAAP